MINNKEEVVKQLNTELAQQNEELKIENEKLKSMIVSLKTTKEENTIKIDYEEEYKLLKEKYVCSVKLIKQLSEFISKNID